MARTPVNHISEAVSIEEHDTIEKDAYNKRKFYASPMTPTLEKQVKIDPEQMNVI